MILALFLACNGGKDTAADTTPPPEDSPLLAALSMERVKAHVDLLAGDDFAGRTPGSQGHADARDYLLGEMADIGLEPIGDSYSHAFPLTLDDTRYTLDSSGQAVPIEATEGVNLVGVLPGSDPALADEYIVLMAHYDHLGADPGGEIYNGAFDDITGVAALLELAEAMQASEVALPRSILFILTDAEEGGLNGSAAWLTNTGIDLDDIVFGLSVDPLGRGVLPDYWPLVLLGVERSPGLKARWQVLADDADVDVIFVNRSPIPIFGSDQDSFYALEEPISALWFVSPGMTWYHTTDDAPETIDYRTVRDHLRFLAGAIAELASDDQRYTDAGPQDLTAEDAQQAIKLLQGAQGSAELSDSERGDAQDLIDALTPAADGDADALSSLNGPYLQAALFILFDLPVAHPGQVPPPWPAGE